MNNVDQSFASDMNTSFLEDSIIEGFRAGAVIDHMVESTVEYTGLFENKAEKERKKKLSGEDSAEDVDLDSLMLDGDMIDDFL